MKTRVRIDGLSHTYPGAGQAALTDVSLTVEPGELLCLVGPSGCGKTTLLKAVSGLIEPDEGAIVFDDEPVTHVPPERRRAVMVFQSHLLFPFMSVIDNVGFGLRMRDIPRTQWLPTARDMLGRVKLTGYERRRPSTLSAGQQQRVALARALVAEPRVLLLDEPLANLDRHLREEMRTVILELQRSARVTTICVTHDQEEAVLLGDRIAMLSSGSLVQVGEAEAFYERPASVHVARFFGNHNQIEAERVGPTVISGSGTLDLRPERSAGQPQPDAPSRAAAATAETAAPSAASSEPGAPSGTGVADRCASWPREGPVCVHIRPEAIELVDSRQGARNVLEGTVVHRVYVGTHVRYAVDVAGQPWQVITGPHTRRYKEGERVLLRLPPERIWLTRE